MPIFTEAAGIYVRLFMRVCRPESSKCCAPAPCSQAAGRGTRRGAHSTTLRTGPRGTGVTLVRRGNATMSAGSGERSTNHTNGNNSSSDGESSQGRGAEGGHALAGTDANADTAADGSGGIDEAESTAESSDADGGDADSSDADSSDADSSDTGESAAGSSPDRGDGGDSSSAGGVHATAVTAAATGLVLKESVHRTFYGGEGATQHAGLVGSVVLHLPSGHACTCRCMGALVCSYHTHVAPVYMYTDRYTCMAGLARTTTLISRSSLGAALLVSGGGHRHSVGVACAHSGCSGGCTGLRAAGMRAREGCGSIHTWVHE